MPWILPLLSILLMSLIASSAGAAAAPAEVRGTWLSIADHQPLLLTPDRTADTMRRLREIGLNTVYVSCWSDGHTAFPSWTLQQAIGVTHKINLPGQPKQRDLLRESMIEAHRSEMLHFAWFESGLILGDKSTGHPLRLKKPQWLLRDKNGNDIGPDGMVWLNPAHPEVRAFVAAIVMDAARNYDIDGIHFDHCLAWPDARMGHDEFTRHAYMTEHGGSPVPDDANDAEWRRWRAAKVTELVEQISNGVRRERPDILISASAPAHGRGRDDFAMDWSAWLKARLVDEVVPRADREPDLSTQLEAAGDRKGDLVAWLGGAADASSFERHATFVDFTRKRGARGHAWSSALGVLDVFPAHLTQFYDVLGSGHAPNPRRAADWRPPPVVGVRRGSSWRLRVPQAGTYIVVAKKDGTWTELIQRRSIGGNVDIRDDKYQAVEMLRDRRGSRDYEPR